MKNNLTKVEEIKTGNDLIDINADYKDSIIIQRHFSKHTLLDLEIQNLTIPKKPIWLNIVIRMIRLYQKRVSPTLGNRCVFDPSCSRYSELAFREKGFTKGILLTFKRLKRCKPSNGGKDILT